MIYVVLFRIILLVTREKKRSERGNDGNFEGDDEHVTSCSAVHPAKRGGPLMLFSLRLDKFSSSSSFERSAKLKREKEKRKKTKFISSMTF